MHSSRVYATREGKFKFGYAEIEFVGHIITAEGHRPVARLIEKIKAQLRPSSSQQLRAFLGQVNYYREFLPNATRIASPLYNLLVGVFSGNGRHNMRRFST